MTRILFLMSDTGGGHRAAANAVAVALREEEPGCDVRIEDGLVKAASFPANRSPAIYAWGMKHARWAWGSSFALLNGRRRARLLGDFGFPGLRKRLTRLIASHEADVVVSTHPLLTRVAERANAATPRRVPFGIVVTDLVSGHASWYEPLADFLCLPTAEALARAAQLGVPRDKMTLTGQPVHPKAGAAATRRSELRARFGWSTPVVLLVGGGDGVGDLGARARALDRSGVDARIVVVCGRNEKLRSELAAAAWRAPAEILGFVDNLHELMAAADILVTKGGPGSVIEGCVAGLPVLIYDYLPGQEIGNVTLVERAGAGRYVPKTSELVPAVTTLLADPASRTRMSDAARSLAVPDSAHRIAMVVLRFARHAGREDRKNS